MKNAVGLIFAIILLFAIVSCTTADGTALATGAQHFGFAEAKLEQAFLSRIFLIRMMAIPTANLLFEISFAKTAID